MIERNYDEAEVIRLRNHLLKIGELFKAANPDKPAPNRMEGFPASFEEGTIFLNHGDQKTPDRPSSAFT